MADARPTFPEMPGGRFDENGRAKIIYAYSTLVAVAGSIARIAGGHPAGAPSSLGVLSVNGSGSTPNELASPNQPLTPECPQGPDQEKRFDRSGPPAGAALPAGGCAPRSGQR
jgi:hypothetical protein